MAAGNREDGGGKRLRVRDEERMPRLTSDSEPDSDSEDEDDEDDDDDDDDDDDTEEELSDEEAQRRYFEDRQKQVKASADSWAALLFATNR